MFIFTLFLWEKGCHLNLMQMDAPPPFWGKALFGAWFFLFWGSDLLFVFLLSCSLSLGGSCGRLWWFGCSCSMFERSPFVGQHHYPHLLHVPLLPSLLVFGVVLSRVHVETPSCLCGVVLNIFSPLLLFVWRLGLRHSVEATRSGLVFERGIMTLTIFYLSLGLVVNLGLPPL